MCDGIIVFSGCPSKLLCLLFFFSCCFDLNSPGAEVWFIACSNGAFADEGTGKVIDSSGRKIFLLKVNISQQTLSSLGWFVKFLFHCDEVTNMWEFPFYLNALSQCPKAAWKTPTVLFLKKNVAINMYCVGIFTLSVHSAWFTWSLINWLGIYFCSSRTKTIHAVHNACQAVQ